ncbi:fas-associated death domain protein [Phlebotomus argentipes]|uniref:fas-associated death domain protein n=1 Tax=Phlebotomus argentipes TaxID=94469 RepID=UPI0028934F39|nr:fas-associated death domain protein [Phlebotomus argentipes]
MSPHEKYETVKLAFVRSLEKREDLRSVKELFRKDVSRRRLDFIETPAHLMSILEAQSLIAEDITDGFRMISNLLGDPGLQLVVTKFQQEISQSAGKKTPGINIYAEERRSQASLGEVASKGKEKKGLSIPRETKEEIFRLVAEQIGKYWLTFSRNLGFRQAELDSVQEQHRDLPTRVYVILERLEESQPDEMFNLICKALSESRRNDLQERVRGILLKKSRPV